MKLLLIAGLSGAGQGQIRTALEDLGYACAEGLSPELAETFAALCQTRGNTKAAVVLEPLPERSAVRSLIKRRREMGWEVRLLFVEADPALLLRRFSANRRRHPLLAEGVSLEAAIEQERQALRKLKAQADAVIDMTHLTVAQVKERVTGVAGDENGLLRVGVLSFGYQYGVPADADLVFDVRFLPNPFYIPELRDKTGAEPEVYDYVFSDGRAQALLERLFALVDYLIPQYRREGKAVLTIAVGCTGGRHRSVAIAEALTRHLNENNEPVRLLHRDWTRKKGGGA